MHGDHCAGVPFLLVDAMLGSKRQTPLVVAGPAGTRQSMEVLREALFPGSHVMRPKFPYQYLELAPGRPNIVAGATVTPFPALHTPETSPTMLRIVCGEKVVTYTGDTDWTDAIVAAAEGADLLISECYFYEKPIKMHMSYMTLKANLPKLKAKSIVLTHMSDDMLRRVSQIPERCASDGLVIEI
jgi:ribonuclease BN (tRNA processing enzyme)